MIDRQANPDLLADGMIVMRRHERQHARSRSELERVQKVGAAERLGGDFRAPRAFVVVHDVIGTQQDIDDAVAGRGQRGAEIAQLGREHSRPR